MLAVAARMAKNLFQRQLPSAVSQQPQQMVRPPTADQLHGSLQLQEAAARKDSSRSTARSSKRGIRGQRPASQREAIKVPLGTRHNPWQATQQPQSPHGLPRKQAGLIPQAQEATESHSRAATAKRSQALYGVAAEEAGRGAMSCWRRLR